MNLSNQSDLFSCSSPSVLGYRYFAVAWGCCVTVTGTLGNLLTVLAFCLDARLRTRFNVLIVNLAVADLLYCTVLQPMSVDSYLHLRWRSGATWCRVFGFLLFVSNSVSIITLCLLAAGRYLLVAKRQLFDRVFSKQGTVLLVVLAWALGVASFAPLWPVYVFVPSVCTCSFHRTEGRPYSTILLFFYFFVGLGCVGVFYLLIYRRVKVASRALLKYRVSRRSSKKKTLSPSLQTHSGVASAVTTMSEANTTAVSEEKHPQTQTPAVSPESCVQTIDTQPKASSAPAEASSAPAEASSAPAEASSSPAEASSAPAEASSAPAEASSAPAEASSSPAEASSAPAEASSAPAEASFSPAEASSAPAEASFSPAEASSAPAEASSAPAEASSSPAEASFSPAEASSAPAEASFSPAEASFSPAEASSTPASTPAEDVEFRRVTRMCFIVFLCFVLCFSPFIILNIVDKQNRAPQVLHMLSANLTWLNSCINPVLYAIMNRQFRQTYHLLLRLLLRLLRPPFTCSSGDKLLV